MIKIFHWFEKRGSENHSWVEQNSPVGLLGLIALSVHAHNPSVGMSS